MEGSPDLARWEQDPLRCLHATLTDARQHSQQTLDSQPAAASVVVT